VAPSKLILVSPLQGWSTPLDEAPDAVFAGRMLGDGVAIDPTGATLYAPCDGTLVVVPTSKHAVTLRADNGAELLLHVGIDTVGLGGEGFQLHVREGQRVSTGERLISFDLDLLARRAKSVLTPVILTDSAGFSVSRRSDGCAVNVGDFLLEIVAVADGAAGGAAAPPAAALPAAVPGQSGASVAPAATVLARSVLVSFEHGIHARPAALLAASVKHLNADITIVAGSRKANARSPVALMSLGVRKDDLIAIQAIGPDADAAVAALERSIGGTPQPSVQSTPKALAASPSEKALKGVVASRGLAVGAAFQFVRAVIDVTEVGAGITHESTALTRAREAVRADLQRSVEAGHSAASEVAQAHLELLDDPELIGGAQGLIESGKSAGFAWRSVLRVGIEALRALSDPRMAERADDLFDLESRVLCELSGNRAAGPVLPPESILIANELLPSQLVALDGARLAGICLASGGPTSHVAIIAAAMDIPTLVATGPGALGVPTGTPVVLDAEAGWLYLEPPRMHLELARSQLAERRARRAAEQESAQRECRTADGVRIDVFANVGSVAEAHAAVRNGGEGCGLLRTEFLFLERTSPPGEAEQLDQYQQIARALDGRPLAIRTLDIGGDKPIPYLPLPHEENPALGLRGVRTSLWRPDLLRVQLRAILQVRPLGQARILLPMITDPGEIRAVRLMLDDLRGELGHRETIGLGAMIETPASALMADKIAREADFLSVGTNDLTQYTLAMDRGHSELAPRLDALHPAVLRLIAKTVEAARVHGRTVAVCGGLASDPVAVPILIGLGVHELSMVPAVIPQLKALIATLSVDECTALATHALERETPEAVRALSLHAKQRATP
jgi:phosphoenolpyruvate-protein phosphotransferase